MLRLILLLGAAIAAVILVVMIVGAILHFLFLFAMVALVILAFGLLFGVGRVRRHAARRRWQRRLPKLAEASSSFLCPAGPLAAAAAGTGASRQVGMAPVGASVAARLIDSR
jgi:hypothetical protein